MRVAIDGFNLALPFGTGVATYSMSLAYAIQSAGHQLEGVYGLRTPFRKVLRDINFFEALGAEFQSRAPRSWSFDWGRELSWTMKARRAREIDLRGKTEVRSFAHRLPNFDRLYTVSDLFDQSMRNFRRFGTFTTVALPDPPQIMHWTYPWPIRVKGAKNIYTMHDLVPLKLPYASLDNKKIYHKLMRACIRKGDHICTVSEASRADILDFFPEAEGKVTNTYQAIKPSAQSVSFIGGDEAGIAQALNSIFRLDYQNYFLFFGAIEPKKNVGRLIEAYLSSGIQAPLVIVGRRAWGADVELSLIQRDETRPMKTLFKNIRRIDYLPRRLLMLLVRGARGVAFPSLYEGFGLPVLESMSLGTPVITANTSSMPEVAGSAALLVDPYDVSAIAAAMRQVDSDPELRARLSVAGVAQAENYSMTAYHARLSTLYSSLLTEPGR
ncbi:glycosyltransferase family 4 protein [Sphingopyxis panaciterrae]